MPPASNSAPPLADILRHDSLYWSCISAAEERDGWLLFHNQRLIPRIDPNHAGEFRAKPGQSEQIVREISAFYSALGAVPAAYVDALATPKDLIPTLLQAGFEEWSGALSDLMIFRSSDVSLSSAYSVERVSTHQAKEDWASITGEETPEEKSRLRELYVTQISDPRMTAYLIRVDGEPACRCQLFSSQGLGRVEAVRTHARHRRQGLASAIIRQAVRDSLDKNRLTYIYAEPGGEAQQLYARLGFKREAQHVIRGFLSSLPTHLGAP